MPRTFKVGKEVYEIPENEVSNFLKDMPNAIEVESFVMGKDTFDIPLKDVEAFKMDMPKAQPLKKKESTTSSDTKSVWADASNDPSPLVKPVETSPLLPNQKPVEKKPSNRLTSSELGRIDKNFQDVLYQNSGLTPVEGQTEGEAKAANRREVASLNAQIMSMEAQKKQLPQTDITEERYNPERAKIDKEIQLRKEELKQYEEPKELFDKIPNSQAYAENKDAIDKFLRNANPEYVKELKSQAEKGQLTEQEYFSKIVSPALGKQFEILQEDLDILKERGMVDKAQEAVQLTSEIQALQTELEQYKGGSPEEYQAKATELQSKVEQLKSYEGVDEVFDVITKLDKVRESYGNAVLEIGKTLGLTDETQIQDKLKADQESYGQGSLKAWGQTVANIFDDVDKLGKFAAKHTGIGDILLQPGYEDRQGLMGDAADFFRADVDNLKDMPDTWTGDVLNTAIPMAGLIAEMALFPEIRSARLAKATGGVIKAIPQFTVMEGTLGTVRAWDDLVQKDDKDIAIKTMIAGAEGAAVGTGLHFMGAFGGEFGNYLATITKSNVVPKVAAMATTGAAFGGLDAFEQYLQTGEVDWSQSSAVGVGATVLGVPFSNKASYEAARIVQEAHNRAKTHFYSSSRELIEQSLQATGEPEAMLREAIEQKKQGNENEANILNTIANLQLITKDIVKDPERFKKEINESQIDPKEKEFYLAKIDETVKKVKEIRTNEDKVIAEQQTKLGLPTEPSIELADATKETLEKIENGEPVINARLKEASTDLYKRYKGLNSERDNHNRKYTTSQLDKAIDGLAEQITKLEEMLGEQGETGEFSRIVKPESKVAQEQVKLQDKSQDKQEVKLKVDKPAEEVKLKVDEVEPVNDAVKSKEGSKELPKEEITGNNLKSEKPVEVEPVKVEKEKGPVKEEKNRTNEPIEEYNKVYTVRDLAERPDGESSAAVFSALKKGDEFKVNGKTHTVTMVSKDKRYPFTDKKGKERYYDEVTIRIKDKDGKTITSKLWKWDNGKSQWFGNFKHEQFSRDIEGEITTDLINENNPFHTKSDSYQLAEKYLGDINNIRDSQIAETKPVVKKNTESTPKGIKEPLKEEVIPDKVEKSVEEPIRDSQIDNSKQETLPKVEQPVQKKQVFSENEQPKKVNTKGEPIKDTDKFNEWFEGSKVVDTKGSPQVVHHGTGKDFAEFSPTESKHLRGTNPEGYWFTDSQDNAKTFGDKVMDVYLVMKNPLVIDMLDKESVRKVVSPDKGKRSVSPDMFNYKNGQVLHKELERGIDFRREEDPTIDGVIYKNMKDRLLSTNYRVFSSDQVKRTDAFTETKPEQPISEKQQKDSKTEIKGKEIEPNPEVKAKDNIPEYKTIPDLQEALAERKISKAEYDKKLQELRKGQAVSKNASIGEYETGEPIVHGNITELLPVEFPELVAFAKELIGNTVVRKMSAEKRGMFMGRRGIKLNRELFTEGNEAQLAATMAHEIGHMVDYLPDMTMGRGNLLGRLHTLKNFINSGIAETKPWSATELKELKESARDNILADNNITLDNWNKGKVPTKDKKRISAEIKAEYERMKKDNAILLNSDIAKELKALSKKWRPWDEETATAKFKAYRNSAAELYADAISVLMNNPGMLEREAPKFYERFFSKLDNKPEVRDALFAVQDLIRDPLARDDARLDAIYKGFTEAREKRKVIAQTEIKPNKLGPWDMFVSNFVSKIAPAIKFMPKDEKLGLQLSAKQALRNQLESLQFINNKEYLYLMNTKKEIFDALEAFDISIDDLGAIGMFDRNLSDRIDKANPLGLQRDVNAKMREHLLSKYSEDQVKVIEQVLKNFHEKTFKIVEEGYKEGLYKPEVFKDKIEPYKDSYLAYQVVDYITKNHISEGVKEMTGTLKEIENPIESTMFKTMSIIRATQKQRATNRLIEALTERDSENISNAEPILSHPDGNRTGNFKIEQGKGQIKYYKDGVWSAINVDPWVADVFAKSTPENLDAITAIFHGFNSGFKPAVTKYNLGFAFAFNIIKDSWRSTKGLYTIMNSVPGNKRLITDLFSVPLQWAYRMPSSVKEAYRVGKGEFADISTEMLDNAAFDFRTGVLNMYDPKANESIDIMNSKFGIGNYRLSATEQAKQRSKIAKAAVSFLDLYERAVGAMELGSKINGYKILRKRGFVPEASGYYTRNYIGTPNYKERGNMTHLSNEYLPFSNVIAQGLRSDADLAFSGKTAGAYWFAQSMYTVAPAMGIGMAVAGLFGDDIKRMYDGIPSYDLLNYFCIPTGTTKTGKTKYIRIPLDETSRVIYGTSMLLAKGLTEQDMPDNAQVKQLVKVGSSFTPSPSPLIKLVANNYDYWVNGNNPYDSFYSKNVIDRKEFEAGGWEANKQMLEWSIETSGLSYITRMYQFDPSKNTTTEHIKKNIPIINRIYKESDKGIYEKMREIQDENIQEKAEEGLAKDELVYNYSREYLSKTRDFDKALFKETADKMIKEYFGPTIESEEKDAKRAMEKKLKANVVMGIQSPLTVYTAAIINSRTNQDKADMLTQIKKDVDAVQYEKLVKFLKEEGIISKDVLAKIKK